ncbi:ATP-binding protein [Serratia symbiotica]|uniref:ATP-binding protein n=1 Tax=Serratia symbiotica TaxID=138074 RepID=UPI00136066DD|nr:ATP-binding protein [Serratia symbiotica]MBQ0956452.1 ATP-binding protein [Serratia symbiotica]
MRDISAVFKRLQNIIPSGVSPKFTSAEDLMAWHLEEGRKYSENLMRENHRTRMEKIFGRSGIRERYQKCTFKNYHVENDGQRRALTLTKSWLANFGSGCVSFVFSGSTGTGKNHLSAAIGNALLEQEKTVLIITVADLMLEVRAGYNGGKSEDELLTELCRVDLLVLDEVGVQRDTKNEFVILHQIIDRRTAMMKPVGVLTNLNHADLAEVLGPRVMDRLMMDGGVWINFNWESYRSRLKSK